VSCPGIAPQAWYVGDDTTQPSDAEDKEGTHVDVEVDADVVINSAGNIITNVGNTTNNVDADVDAEVNVVVATAGDTKVDTSKYCVARYRAVRAVLCISGQCKTSALAVV
jgi:hypothetical protein